MLLPCVCKYLCMYEHTVLEAAAATNLFRYPDVLQCVAPNKDLRHAPEAVTILQTAQHK